jgi:hypothetical protein
MKALRGFIRDKDLEIRTVAHKVIKTFEDTGHWIIL